MERPAPLHSRFRPPWAAAAIAVVLLGGAANGYAESLSLPPPGREGWMPYSFPGSRRPTEYAAVVDEGLEAVRSDSECSASALILPLDDIDFDRTPILSWRWKVHRPLAATDERSRAGDDFAARVYVAFRLDAARTSIWQQIRHAAAEAIYGTELPGSAISYVWSTREPAGQSWDNPFTSATRMISLGMGEMGGWRGESVDVPGDYRSTMGGAPPPLQFIALMTDSDDRCSAAGAYFADFRFRATVSPPASR